MFPAFGVLPFTIGYPGSHCESHSILCKLAPGYDSNGFARHARHIAIQAVYNAAQVMDNPADLINVAIAELIKKRCELPAFSTLDRLARRIRTLVNSRFFQNVVDRLTPEEQQKLYRRH